MSFLQYTTRDRRLRIRRGEPIEECGVTLYPITMDHYEDFTQCRNSIAIRLSSLPVRYMTMDYLSAIFALELDALKENPDAPTGGIFYHLMQLFALSMRVEMNGQMLNDGLHTTVDVKGNIGIEYLEYTQTDVDGEPKIIHVTPFEFSSQIRPLIAAQNQIVLPDESENSDLVADYERKKQIQSKGPPLNTDLDDLVSSVAYLSGVSDKEIMQWTVRDFENRRRAIERVMKHQIYAQAEMGGMVSFKNGNPYPSWCFDAIDETLGTMAAADLAKTLSGAAAPGSM